jgi:1-acyl-sn-glycerol-3-phosphate acyltransferase
MYTLRRICQMVPQFLVSVLFKIFLLPFIKRQPNDLPKGAPTACLVVSNHRRMTDPMVMAAAMPYRYSTKIFPFAFMTSNRYYDSLLRPFVWLTGCFPARNNAKQTHTFFGVDGSTKLLKADFSVVIYPEGRLARKGRLPAHSGVVRISQGAPKVPMLLCHITYKRGLKAFIKREFATVRFKVVEQPDFSDPELIMDAIYAL